MNEFMDMPSPQPPQQETPEEEQSMEVTSTGDFQQALEMGDLAAAEQWLETQKSMIGQEGFKYNERWADHREGELFKAYRAQEDWKAALRIAQNSIQEASRQPRIDRLVEVSGLSVEEIEAL